MAKTLSKEEYLDLDKEAFVDAYKEFIHEYFKENYGDLFKVGEITIDNYFDEIDSEFEKYKTFNHVPSYVWSRDAKLDLSVNSVSDYLKIREIDSKKFSNPDFNWQNSLYEELKHFFDFFKMPYITPWVHLKFGDA